MEKAIVGYLLVYPFQQDEKRIVNIVRLMIDARYQDKGLGKRLLDAAIAWIASWEAKADLLRISTSPENERALSLYRSRGFVEQGLEDGEVALYKTVIHQPD